MPSDCRRVKRKTLSTALSPDRNHYRLWFFIGMREQPIGLLPLLEQNHVPLD